MPKPRSLLVTRRDFLRLSAPALGAGVLGFRPWINLRRRKKGITIGMFTDSHYADREPVGSRYYRDSAAKLAAFVCTMNKAKPSFAIMLGDFIDKAETLEVELGYLERIRNIYRQFKGKCYYVIGNHDVATFSKEQFIRGTGMPAAHYSFDRGSFHFIVLDANYNKDFSPYKAGNFVWTETYIPPAEQAWLEVDLARTKKPTVVFIHQRLDAEENPHGVKNAPQVRKILQDSGRVIAVFQGHDHAGAYRRIAGIPYVTLRAMVEGPGLENNAYALVSISKEGSITSRGFAKQPDHVLQQPSAAEPIPAASATGRLRLVAR